MSWKNGNRRTLFTTWGIDGLGQDGPWSGFVSGVFFQEDHLNRSNVPWSLVRCQLSFVSGSRNQPRASVPSTAYCVLPTLLPCPLIASQASPASVTDRGHGRTGSGMLYRPQCDRWSLYDASRPPPALITWEESGSMTMIDSDLFNQIQRSVGE